MCHPNRHIEHVNAWKKTLTWKQMNIQMSQRVYETKAMRRFFLSYTLHLTSVIFIPLLAAIVLLSIAYYYTTRYFGVALVLDLFGEDPVLEYVLAFVFAIVALISAVYLLSVALAAYHYAKNMFLPLKREFFDEQVHPGHGYGSSIQQASYPPKPTTPPPPRNAPSSLTTAYAESSDRARWGPR